jgi:hypothetical protein
MKKSTRNKVYFSGEFGADEACTVNSAGHCGFKWVGASDKERTDSSPAADIMRCDYQNSRSKNGINGSMSALLRISQSLSWPKQFPTL